jgi:hypothetical protein
MLRAGQEVFDRRGVPSSPAPWRAFAHGLKLSGNLLERAAGRCRLDPSDQPDKPVTTVLRLGPVQQADLKDAFIDQPSYGATQPLNRPGGCMPAVEDLHDVAPGLIRTHAPHRWKPSVQPRQDTF